MRRPVVLLGALALTVSECGRVSQSTQGRTAHQKLAEDKTFTQAISSDPRRLDPQMTLLAVVIQTDRYLYDTLLDGDSAGKPMAGLADKWRATTTRATLTLRRGITCADGSPLTAADVNFAAGLSRVRSLDPAQCRPRPPSPAPRLMQDQAPTATC
ncbi:hypothetical protein [Streptomyces sp. NPDC051286]|uniref:hypothetical protein n=1 Tax=Streptomyces sp. NPDC051286 TaxID=3365647 RepID=UPI0037B57D7D